MKDSYYYIFIFYSDNFINTEVTGYHCLFYNRSNYETVAANQQKKTY